MSKIVMTAFGSLGDLNPFIGVAQELQKRGHQATIATTDNFRAHVETSGLGFHAVRPSWDLVPPPIALEQILLRGLFPHIRESFVDLAAAVEGADLLVALNLAFASPLVAEKTGIPWVSVVLEPASFFTASERTVNAPIFGLPRLLGSAFWGTGCSLGLMADAALLSKGIPLAEYWALSLLTVRAELGLSPGRELFFEDHFSPRLILGLFSPLLGPPEPDWPPQTLVKAFVFFDHLSGFAGLPPHLKQFLDSGDPPVVFTLGSDASIQPGGELFLHESLLAARLVGRRAVLLDWSSSNQGPAQDRLEPAADWIAAGYIPFSEVFPRAAAIVHHGGIGTTALALRAGRPMLVVPYNYSQPDTAARVTRLGVAATTPRHLYSGPAAAALLNRLLHPRYATRAAEIGRQIQAEDGLGSACDAIENVLANPGT